MAQDYDEARPDVAEASEANLKSLQTMNAPDARNVAADLDYADETDGVTLPGADLSGEELVIAVIPQAEDEFTCAECFLVRHRSQIARVKGSLRYCRDCES